MDMLFPPGDRWLVHIVSEAKVGDQKPLFVHVVSEAKVGDQKPLFVHVVSEAKVGDQKPLFVHVVKEPGATVNIKRGLATYGYSPTK